MSSNSSVRLVVDGVSHRFTDRPVLTDVTFTAAASQRLALIGENGTGKTTLLRIISGDLSPDQGQVSLSGFSGDRASVGLLPQDAHFPEEWDLHQAVEHAVDAQRQVLRGLEQAAEDISSPEGADRYAALLNEALRTDAWSLDARIARVLDGLDLGAIEADRMIVQLSGGQRARLSLACLLLSAPEVLLLDEPTNHLDEAGAVFLTQILTDWPGVVVVASHDRAFLDECATGILDLDPAPVAHSAGAPAATDVVFHGGFSAYLEHRTAVLAEWTNRFETEQAQLRRLRTEFRRQHQVGHESWTPRTESRIAQKFYADRNAKVVSRRVNDVRDRLTDLEESQVVKPPRAMHLAQLSSGATRLRGPVISAKHVAVSGRVAPLCLDVVAGEHLLVTGPNGCGKSTLLALLAGTLEPTEGTVHRDSRARIGFLPQEVQVDGDPTAEQWFVALVGEDTADAQPLQSFGVLHPRYLTTKVSALSVGTRRRIVLAAALSGRPDVLLLDEPTNHLSLQLVTELEEAVAGFAGAVVVASHDRWLRRHWVGEVLDLADASARGEEGLDEVEQ